MKNTSRRTTAALTVGVLAAATLTLGAAPVHAEPAPLANTAHLDFLLDTATPDPEPGHTTYRLEQEPELVMPWTYADAREGGTFERVGGGPLDPETGDWGQGAYNTDDISRAAVVYVRHWQQTRSAESREKAYELLRSLAYFQTTEGEDAGNVVLWMQPDGDLNPSAEPVELPDPSDSDDSYWLARTLWALGEGYAAFADEDAEFAAFLQDRLRLGVDAVERDVLGRYGEYDQADGVPVPAWLIADGADATAEALFGLTAYLGTVDDAEVRAATEQLAEGVEQLARTTTDADTTEWPYGAALPWSKSRSMWHAWASQMPTALVRAATVLGDGSLAQPAITEGTQFAPVLLTAGGPDNGWYPSPTERVQIAYGADSRLQASLALADATGSRLFDELATVQGAWFFGLNPADEAMYDPATGVTYDGISPEGSINRNSGAESTIHGLFAMLALDAHAEIAERAVSLTTETERDGLVFLQAEDVVSGGQVETPESGWTGESSWNGDRVRVAAGTSAEVEVGRGAGDGTSERIVEPVSWYVEEGEDAVPVSSWTARARTVGEIEHSVGDQGVTEASGALLPERLAPLARNTTSLEVSASGADLLLDGLLVRPAVVSMAVAGEAGETRLLHNSSESERRIKVKTDDWRASTLRVYGPDGALLDERPARHTEQLRLPAGATATVTS